MLSARSRSSAAGFPPAPGALVAACCGGRPERCWAMAHAGHEHVEFDSTACALAHGAVELAPDGRAVVAVFDSPVARHLVHFAATLGFKAALGDPFDASIVDDNTDVVVCDHDRPELGVALRDALASPARWIGVMGNPRH